jgi:two-component system OmpR family response regulator
MAQNENRPKVLIVDSYRSNADTLAMVFGHDGFETRTAYSAEEALALEWQPDVAILEIILKDMNGFDCALRLRERYADCGIILLYAQVADQFLVAVRRENYELFKKPTEVEAVIGAARRLISASG